MTEGKHDTDYYPGDPFFTVSCGDCGAKYWSTRRSNPVCAKCGGENTKTTPPVLRENKK